jgi:hypothetical protein
MNVCRLLVAGNDCPARSGHLVQRELLRAAQGGQQNLAQPRIGVVRSPPELTAADVGRPLFRVLLDVRAAEQPFRSINPHVPSKPC